MARKYGKEVTIMEPVQEVFHAAEPNSSFASWGIRFAASLEGVITVLSEMSSVEQMEYNLSYMKDFTKLSDDQQETVRKAQEAMAKIPLVPCTTCNYCAKVCPQHISIREELAKAAEIFGGQ